MRGLLGTGPSNPPRPPLLRGHRFDIEIGSNQDIDVESMSNRSLSRGRRGGFEGGDSRGPVPNKPLTTLDSDWDEWRHLSIERGEKTPTAKISLLRKRPVLLRANFVQSGRGVLSKVQMLNLVLGVGVFSPLPIR